MDTKWKNRKKAISFMIFFLGVSLALGGFEGILKNKPSGTEFWQVDKLLEEDYQESGRFREYISGRLEKFLIMATGGSLGYLSGNGVYRFYDSGYYDGYYYDGYFYEDDYDFGYYEDYDYYQNYYDAIQNYDEIIMDYLDSLDDLWNGYSDVMESAGRNPEDYTEELEAWRGELEAFRGELQAYRRTLEGFGYEDGASSSQEKTSLEEQNKKLAQKYHDLIKDDQNLLYSISYEGKVLYANGELAVEDGHVTAPEGYNFFLHFDGEKVRIIKDGKEVDVYGDGFYRDGSGGKDKSDWYVPGYRNFPVEESLKKAEICMAVAKDPVLYVRGAYGENGSRQYDNALYWMNYHSQGNRGILLKTFTCLMLGLALTIVSLICRKSRLEAQKGIARFQAKIWVECKILYFAVLGSGFLKLLWRNSRDLWNEWRYFTYEGNYTEYIENISPFLGEALEEIPAFFYLLLFWSIWLLVNDLRQNKKVWKHGLIAKLYRTFFPGNLEQPLSKRMAGRNILIFLCAVIFGLLMFALAFLGITGRGSSWGMGMLALIGVIGFLAAAYLIGAKNMETAKDLEMLSRYVSEIRDGNYKDFGGQFAGHDLENIMGQMEDIRCGMAKAVDEQMKSERMKVELIANVSHDVKTPLTSIISYVQFLKQEEGLPEHVKDYVAILDEKSQRLKNMVQDVFAVSKAASGELPMHMEKLDFGKLLRQTLADMEEEIGKSPVVFRTDIPGEPVMIMADGQRMYRVFQNLFQNAIQYSLEGSRVYVSLKTDGGLAIASVKNTSHQELERGKDFAERFARGDESRTDGGSGLGLSIAQSFTEACGGEFGWETDADLFVVRVSFRTL